MSGDYLGWHLALWARHWTPKKCPWWRSQQCVNGWVIEKCYMWNHPAAVNMYYVLSPAENTDHHQVNYFTLQCPAVLGNAKVRSYIFRTCFWRSQSCQKTYCLNEFLFFVFFVNKRYVNIFSHRHFWTFDETSHNIAFFALFSRTHVF